MSSTDNDNGPFVAGGICTKGGDVINETYNKGHYLVELLLSL